MPNPAPIRARMSQRAAEIQAEQNQDAETLARLEHERRALMDKMVFDKGRLEILRWVVKMSDEELNSYG